MNTWVIGLGLVCGLVLGATGFSLFALWRAHAMMGDMGQRANAGQSQQDGETRELRESVESLAGRVRELERTPAPAAAVPGMPRAGLNLNKRSQALRMHRQGEAPERIASALELPRQEVELLLKVHRIVLANV